MFACLATDNFFRSRIDHKIDLRHPLAVLASRMPWQVIEARVAHVFSRKGCVGVAMPDHGLFAEQVQRTAVASNAGRIRVPLRIMIALLNLKHEPDEGVVERWCETPTWQFFSGHAYFEHHRPCDGTTLVRFRQLPGEEGMEERLAQSINVAVQLKLIKPKELSLVSVDSIAQHYSIAHPTDSRLLETPRVRLVGATKDTGIDLKQTIAREGQHLRRKAGRYAHVHQFKQMRRAIRCQGTIIGRLQGEIKRNACAPLGQRYSKHCTTPEATRAAYVRHSSRAAASTTSYRMWWSMTCTQRWTSGSLHDSDKTSLKMCKRIEEACQDRGRSGQDKAYRSDQTDGVGAAVLCRLQPSAHGPHRWLEGCVFCVNHRLSAPETGDMA